MLGMQETTREDRLGEVEVILEDGQNKPAKSTTKRKDKKVLTKQ